MQLVFIFHTSVVIYSTRSIMLQYIPVCITSVLVVCCRELSGVIYTGFSLLKSSQRCDRSGKNRTLLF